MNYYRVNTNPLVKVTEGDIRSGGYVYDELGRCVRKVYIDDNVYFVEVADSVLNEGEIMSELTSLQLELFWKLSKNKLRKDEDKNKD